MDYSQQRQPMQGGNSGAAPSRAFVSPLHDAAADPAPSRARPSSASHSPWAASPSTDEWTRRRSAFLPDASVTTELAAIKSSVTSSVSRWMSSFLDPTPSSSSSSAPAVAPPSPWVTTSAAAVHPPATAPRPRAPHIAPCPPDLYAMFPTVDREIVEAVYLEHAGDVDRSLSALLEMTDPDFVPEPEPEPEPVPQQQENARRTAALVSEFAAIAPGMGMGGIAAPGVGMMAPNAAAVPNSVLAAAESARAPRRSYDDHDDDEPSLFDDLAIAERVQEAAAKTKLMFRGMASKLERLTSRLGDEIELNFGAMSMPSLASDDEDDSMSRNSLTMSHHDDASILSLRSGANTPAPAFTTRHDSYGDTPLASPLPAAAAVPAGGPAPPRVAPITISRTASMRSFDSTPSSPFVISEPGDDDSDNEDQDKDVPSSPSQAHLRRHPALTRADSLSRSPTRPRSPLATSAGFSPVVAAPILSSSPASSVRSGLSRPVSPYAASAPAAGPSSSA
ncbi:hypothetical protein H9P43_004525 [Blastocladiella emersonii ATCC 22665]|nr:hypothetical protein H9P43_004525 [Blastocladiella emersonii ATCC 22665]